MPEENPPLDINSANQEELERLPGIGPALAERIQANRPYLDLDELLVVQGIGEQNLNRIRPLLTTAGEEPAGPSEKASPAADQEGQASEEQPGSPVRALLKLPAQPQQDPEVSISKTQLIWLLVTTGFFSVILAAALVLGILSGINGSLTYSNSATVGRLTDNLVGLSDQVERLDGELAELRERMDNFNAISSRVDLLDAQVNDLEDQAQELSDRLDQVEDSANTFQTFLEDLSQYLQTLLSPDEVDNE